MLDYFISHASDDKEEYILPLARALSEKRITYWLDSVEVKWGDPLSLAINSGLKESNSVVLCLSEAFLAKPWPETEFNAAFAASVGGERQALLPLVLNSKEKIFREYPILKGLLYREFSQGVESLTQEMLDLSKGEESGAGSCDKQYNFDVESTHTGKVTHMNAPRRASIHWVHNEITRRLGLKKSLNTGGYKDFPIRWILVDQKAEKIWKRLSRRDIGFVQSIIMKDKKPQISTNEEDKLEEIGFYDGLVLNLCAVADKEEERVMYCVE